MNQLALTTMNDVQLAANAMAGSGYFQDAKQAAQAVVKILAGQEMGFGPFASMTGIYIIQGRPAIGANLMAAAVKRHPKYDYKVIKMQDDVCELTFFQDGQEIGRSVFDLKDAKKAGTKNLDRFARNMLFARAMSNGVRWYVPDVFMGAAVYTPEELGADVDGDGQVVEVIIEQPPQDEGPSIKDLRRKVADLFIGKHPNWNAGNVSWYLKNKLDRPELGELTIDQCQEIIDEFEDEPKDMFIDAEPVTAEKAIEELEP